MDTHTYANVKLLLIGVEKDACPPLPPNRACDFLAHGSPVSGFLIGIGSLFVVLVSW